MKKQADILTQYAEIDEAHVDALLQEELRRNRKNLLFPETLRPVKICP